MNRRKLRRILRKALDESMSSYGNIPVESFTPEGLGYVEMVEEILYIMEELSDGSVRLMDPTEYEDMLVTMQDLAADGDEDIADYLPQLTGNQQGQYVRIALR